MRAQLLALLKQTHEMQAQIVGMLEGLDAPAPPPQPEVGEDVLRCPECGASGKDVAEAGNEYVCINNHTFEEVSA